MCCFYEITFVTSLDPQFKFRSPEFGPTQLAQSSQSTSGIVVKVGFLPGTEVTMENSKPELRLFNFLTCKYSGPLCQHSPALYCSWS